ncbi:MAG: methyltransferase [Clostridia bacterium]|nr:methyltransferase [Clostridia bacterium]
MTRRENFKKTMRHEKPDSLILDLGGNPLSSMEGSSPERLLEFLGYKPGEKENLPFGKGHKIDERILEHLDIDTRSVGTILTPADSLYKRLGDNLYMDEWGITRKYTGLYWDIVDYPLKGAGSGDLDDYRWPNPDSVDFSLIEEYAEQARCLYEKTDYVICAEHPVYGVFEIGCWMCGFDDFLIKMAIDGDFIKKFSEKILAYQEVVSRHYYSAVGPYIHYTSSGDDFATQTSLFMSPDMFRKHIKPYFLERVRLTKNLTDAAFLHHSCGNVHDIIDDLADCGVDILNPIQPTNDMMAPKRLKNEFGEKIVFHGGLDTQQVLPFGTEETVREAVYELVGSMNREGGYIFAAAHNIQPDVPPENVVHMFRAARNAGNE